MTSKPAPLWRQALALLTPRLILAQLGLFAGVFALSLVWLRLPDASALEVAASALLALLIVAAATLGESRLIVSLTGRAPRSLIRRTLPLLAGVALWLAWSALLTHLSQDDARRAGYWNSRAPHQLRYFFTDEHILLWLGWIGTTLRWIGAGLIAALAFAFVAAARPARAAALALSSPSFWLVLLVSTTAATFATTALMAWTPFHGLPAETLSLVLRLAFAALLDGTIACWLLAVLALCVRRADSDADYTTPSGGPVVSQPRTVDAP